MHAHLFAVDDRPGHYRFSGYGACGDPFDGAGVATAKSMQPRAFDAIVDMPGEFILDHEGLLWILTGALQGSRWKPSELVYAARLGWRGLKLIHSTRKEIAS